MFSYLFYRFYRMSEKSTLSKIPQYSAIIIMTVLFTLNILVIFAFISKQNILPFPFHNNLPLIATMGLILLILGMVFIRNDRFLLIQEKYSNETNSQRNTGKFVAIAYIIISFFSILVVGLYKPGYLP